MRGHLEGRREKGEGKREKGEVRREKGKGRSEKGEGRSKSSTEVTPAARIAGAARIPPFPTT